MSWATSRLTIPSRSEQLDAMNARRRHYGLDPVPVEYDGNLNASVDEELRRRWSVHENFAQGNFNGEPVAPPGDFERVTVSQRELAPIIRLDPVELDRRPLDACVSSSPFSVRASGNPTAWGSTSPTRTAESRPSNYGLLADEIITTWTCGASAVPFVAQLQDTFEQRERQRLDTVRRFEQLREAYERLALQVGGSVRMDEPEPARETFTGQRAIALDGKIESDVK